jgi:hypothetical protein
MEWFTSWGRDGASDVAHDYVTQAEGLDGAGEGACQEQMWKVTQ